MITDNDVNELRSLIAQYEATIEAADRADYLSDTDDPIEADKWAAIQDDKTIDAMSLSMDIEEVVERMYQDQPLLTEAVMRYHEWWNVWRPTM